MGMFDKYDKLNPDYIPNNTTTYLGTEYLTIDSEVPRPMYDIKNNFIGYTWDEGEFFDFKLSVDDMITVRENSLIYDKPGEGPDLYTIAEMEGQQAYNVVDAKSWTFTGKAENLYIWIEDTELTYPTKGDKSIMINTDMTDAYIQMNIYNFRWENIYSQNGEIGESDIVLHIDNEMSETLKPGVYYVTLKICSEKEHFVKSRFMININ